MIIRGTRISVSLFRSGGGLSRSVCPFLISLLLHAWALPALAGGRDVAIVDPSRFREWTRTGASVSPPPESVLVFSAEDQVIRFLDAGIPFGSVPLFQVVPLEKGIGPEHFEEWRSSLPKPAQEEGAFSLDNGLIRGAGKFQRIRVGPVTLPAGWPKHPVLVVDAGFFLPLYKDEVRTPMVPLVMKLVATLHDASVRWDSARIIDRNLDPGYPLEFGYVPELLREVLSDPDRFRSDLPERWALLDRAQYFSFFGQREEAVREYEVLAGMECPAAVPYQAAVLAFREEGSFRDGIRHLVEAARKDRAYLRGFLVQGAAFWDRGELAAAETILREGRKLFPENEMIRIGLARNLAEQAVNVREADPAAADRMIREALSLRVPEDVRAEILEGWGGGPVIPIAPRLPEGGKQGTPGRGSRIVPEGSRRAFVFGSGVPTDRVPGRSPG